MLLVDFNNASAILYYIRNIFYVLQTFVYNFILWCSINFIGRFCNVLNILQNSNIRSEDVISIEGYLEQLPVGKKKETLLKTWKRVYCKAKDGIIYFYKVVFIVVIYCCYLLLSFVVCLSMWLYHVNNSMCKLFCSQRWRKWNRHHFCQLWVEL